MVEEGELDKTVQAEHQKSAEFSLPLANSKFREFTQRVIPLGRAKREAFKEEQ